MKLTTASSVYAGVSTAESTLFTPVRPPSVIASVDTSDALSMMLPKLSYVQIDVSDAAPTCLVGVVTCEIVNVTSVRCCISLPAILKPTRRPPASSHTASVTTGVSSAGSLNTTLADAPTCQPACKPVSDGSSTSIRPPIGTLPAVVKRTSDVPV